MSRSLTVRLSDEEADAVRRIAQQEHRPPGEVGARIIDEWLRLDRFPQIEFRTICDKRVACVRGGIEVWQVMMVARDYNDDVERIAEHLVLKPDQVQAAIDYAAAYSSEIEVALARTDVGFDELKRRFPGIRRASLSDDDLARVQLDDLTS